MGAPLGLRPPPYEEIPIPKMPEVVPQPAEVQPQRLPAGAGRSGKAGASLNIASKFLRGWLRGRNKSEAQQREMIEAEFDNFNDQRESAHKRWSSIVADPDAYGGPDSDEYKQAVNQARTRYQAASSGLADLTEKHVKPAKGKKGKDGGGGIGQFFLNMFTGGKPEVFTQNMVEQMRTEADRPTEPARPGPQQRLAGALMKEKQEGIDLRKEYSDLIGLSNSGDITPEQTERLYTIEDTLNPVYGPERLTRDIGRKIGDHEQLSPQEKGVAMQAGLLPKPEYAAPMPFNDNGKLTLIIPETTFEGSKIRRLETGIPWSSVERRDQQVSAFTEKFQTLKSEIKSAYPDWTPQQVSFEALRMVGLDKGADTGQLTPNEVIGLRTKAIDAAYSRMSPEDREKAKALITMTPKRNWVFRTQLVDPGAGHSWYEVYDWLAVGKRYDMTARELQEQEQMFRSLVESELRTLVPGIGQADLNRIFGGTAPLGRQLFPGEYEMTPPPTEEAPGLEPPPGPAVGTQRYVVTINGKSQTRDYTPEQADRARKAGATLALQGESPGGQ